MLCLIDEWLGLNFPFLKNFNLHSVIFSSEKPPKQNTVSIDAQHQSEQPSNNKSSAADPCLPQQALKLSLNRNHYVSICSHSLCIPMEFFFLAGLQLIIDIMVTREYLSTHTRMHTHGNLKWPLNLTYMSLECADRESIQTPHPTRNWTHKLCCGWQCSPLCCNAVPKLLP